MPLFSSLKSKMRRESVSDSNPNHQADNSGSKDEKASKNLEASDVLGDSPSFKNGNGNGNGHPALTSNAAAAAAGASTTQSSRTRSPSESASSLRGKNSSSMLKMFSGTRSPSSSSISSQSKKRHSIMSSSVDNLGRPSSAAGVPNHQQQQQSSSSSSSSPPVSNSAVAAASLRSYPSLSRDNTNNNNGLPTLKPTNPGDLLHAFNHPDATTPTSASFGTNPTASNPRPSDLFAGKGMEWGSIGASGREAPAPKAEDLQSFLKARRQWVPTFVTEDDAPTAVEKSKPLEEISFSSPETSTSTGVMSLKDLDASHERKRKLLGELPLTGGSLEATSSSLNAGSTASTSTSKGTANSTSKAPSSPPVGTSSSATRPGLGSPSSPTKEKAGRSTSFRNSIFSSNKRSNSKDQSSAPPLPTTSNVVDQKTAGGKKVANSAAIGAGLGAGLAAAVAAPSKGDDQSIERVSKSSADTQATTTAPQSKVSTTAATTTSSSTTDPKSGAADVLASSNSSSDTATAEENSQRPGYSTIRESIDSSAQGFETPEGGSVRNSLNLEEDAAKGNQDSAVGDETVVNEEQELGKGESSKLAEGNLPSLNDNDLETGQVIGSSAINPSGEEANNKSLNPIQTSIPAAAPAIVGAAALSPEKPPRPTKADSRTPTTSRPPSPSHTERNALKSDDTLQGQQSN